MFFSSLCVSSVLSKILLKHTKISQICYLYRKDLSASLKTDSTLDVEWVPQQVALFFIS